MLVKRLQVIKEVCLCRKNLIKCDTKAINEFKPFHFLIEGAEILTKNIASPTTCIASCDIDHKNENNKFSEVANSLV